MGVTGKTLTSTLNADGTLTVELVERTLDDPTGYGVVIKVEAAPINPSDLGLLFASADLATASYSPGKIVAKIAEPALSQLAKRFGEAMIVGNEGSGIVVAAGEAPEAQELLGKRVACVPSGMYAQYRATDARACMVLPEPITAEQGAGAFVNPLTVQGFVETMRREGFKGIVHTAAASNLGQMLVKLCREERVLLVNIVRNPAQAAILKELGAEYVLNSTAPDFYNQLVAAIEATGAMLAFDAIGGGTLQSQILSAMEVVASKDIAFSRYGSDVRKRVYIYGLLDHAPTVITRNFGFGWDIGGWLLGPFLAHIGVHGGERMRQRVLEEITTIFASSYKTKVSLEEMLTREAVAEYTAQRTGEKYLVTPNG
jgi:NADPH:quinone reductase-like Zn-dependent oxidoreductase